MKKNTFILTTGLSGSSVITGLLKQAGLWCGETTEYKNNSTGKYETYENSEFVQLNDQLVASIGKPFNSKSWYDLELRDEFTKLLKAQDLTKYKKFAKQCNLHNPWVLKDPKLWITLGFWLELFKDQDFHVIVLSRNINQLWISQTNKRIIYDYHYLKHSEEQSKLELLKFIKSNQINFIDLVYEDFIENPEQQLIDLNHFLDSSLTLQDWNHVYQKKQNNYPIINTIKAVLIYLKNYLTRIK